MIALLQGWGNWFNTMVLVVLLAAFGETKTPYDTKQLDDVWRISYGIGLIPIIIMLVWRVFFLRGSSPPPPPKLPTPFRPPLMPGIAWMRAGLLVL